MRIFSLQNKEFVYRGNECERVGDFIQRLQSEFTGATILSSSAPPSENIKNSEGQCLQILSVKPLPSIESIFLCPEIPDQVRNFYKVNKVNEFQYDKPFHRPEKDSENEFKVLSILLTSVLLYYSNILLICTTC